MIALATTAGLEALDLALIRWEVAYGSEIKALEGVCTGKLCVQPGLARSALRSVAIIAERTAPWTVISSSTKLNTEASPSICGRTWREKGQLLHYRGIWYPSGRVVPGGARTKHLADIAVFPAIPSDFDA